MERPAAAADSAPIKRTRSMEVVEILVVVIVQVTCEMLSAVVIILKQAVEDTALVVLVARLVSASGRLVPVVILEGGRADDSICGRLGPTSALLLLLLLLVFQRNALVRSYIPKRNWKGGRLREL